LGEIEIEIERGGCEEVLVVVRVFEEGVEEV
jgi:hypothetical protein